MRTRMLMNVVLCAVFFSTMAMTARADVKLSWAFGDHMVLQRGIPVPVWGTADPGETVTITFRDQKRSATADAKGNWQVKLQPLSVGPAAELIVTGKNSVTFRDVLVGDVWVGSGQSNMAGGTGHYARKDEVLAAMVTAAPYPKLRLCRRGWLEATSGNIQKFSALLFSFGQPLQKELGVPVGLIIGAVGGTPSGRWLSPGMFAASAEIQVLDKKGAIPTREKQLEQHKQRVAKWEEKAEEAKKAGKKPRRKPRGPITVGDLYAAHIAPVVPYAIRGVLWDQGESGTAVPGVDQFTMMGALIDGWRDAWGQGEFPFLYVQKPSGGGCAWDTSQPATRMADAFAEQPAKPNTAASGRYREHHIRIMQHPNTAMVTASDLGASVHPLNKSGYGERACRVALGFTYAREVEIYGPMYDSHVVEGGAVRVRFRHLGKGLATKHGERLQGFEIAGSDGGYHWAQAKIDGDTVVASCPEVTKPASVRYGWGRQHRWANLFNKDGLPALTFTSQP
ncbi:MAG: hypothetical protein HN742_19230 [Lentisphaerae bacterium]|mgnify:FL=1|jgi:sialate O-acetylesterase|nr:hypothetical protein [Lentisphaerota bacterium]MBT4822094.1 hypothetical protein [Lentisphaerota bacterium]MBT5608470.1 hypothetical protein [Lentisphaerota bacterium]MBT7062145.1 hypothetical protein [Lentisphaerota bacterium]MBT7844021.1 hypothetical protein [Lentisphaerota bacterium]